MKRLSIFLFIFTVSFLTINTDGEAAARSGVRKDSGEVRPRPTGDDLFPWPWGTECPFPWSSIEGSYLVRSANDDLESLTFNGTFGGTHLVFDVQEESREVKFLAVAHYDRSGMLVSAGSGYEEADKRIVKAMLTTTDAGKNYVLKVRTYMRTGSNKRCRKENMVMAVTFCPVRGRKCMDTENYILVR